MDNASTSELVTFQIGSGEFCVDIMAVREIRGWTPATPLPFAPPYVKGVINLRGAVLSIIDLSARLGFDPVQPTPRHVIIVVQIGDQIAGLLVDAVTGILAVQSSSILPAPDVADQHAQALTAGVLAIENRMINLVGLQEILPQRLLEAA